MAADRRRARMATRSVVSLMVLVALSASVANIMRVLPGWRDARAEHLAAAERHARNRRVMEGIMKGETDQLLRAWMSDTVRHHRDLEAEYRRAASRLWEAVTPNPPEPPIPTVAQVMEWARTRLGQD